MIARGDPAPSGAAHSAAWAPVDAQLAALPGAVVAFSGGVDSTALLHACVRVLGDDVLAVTADSPSLPRAELADAQRLAVGIGARHVVLATGELASADYVRNGPDRCYHCKSELFERIAAHLGGRVEAAWPVLFGAIADDLGDHRPGARAAAERGVLAPLAAAGIGKEEVRRYSRAHGLPTASKPAMACLASRVPYGTSIDAAMLAKIEAAESALRAMGFSQCRVRHHGEVARVELLPEELETALRERLAICEALREVGYVHAALDLRGYRSGALNEVLP